MKRPTSPASLLLLSGYVIFLVLSRRWFHSRKKSEHRMFLNLSIRGAWCILQHGTTLFVKAKKHSYRVKQHVLPYGRRAAPLCLCVRLYESVEEPAVESLMFDVLLPLLPRHMLRLLRLLLLHPNCGQVGVDLVRTIETEKVCQIQRNAQERDLGLRQHDEMTK